MTGKRRVARIQRLAATISNRCIAGPQAGAAKGSRESEMQLTFTTVGALGRHSRLLMVGRAFEARRRC